jgi:hypothetical protein
MRFLLIALLLVNNAYADTIRSYLNIANQIPRMEMKADNQSQAWARSARNVLVMNDESIAESLIAINQLASDRGQAFFCLPPDVKLDFKTFDGLIRTTYDELSRKNNSAEKMTVSQVALQGLLKKYPCSTNPIQTKMQHVSALLGNH